MEPPAPPAPKATFADGIANVYSRLGMAADRNTQSFYVVPTLTQQQIEAAYRTSWLTRKIHDLPPFEMTRAGRNWQAEAKQITALEEAERNLSLWPKLREALRVARLHGGSALVLGVRQGMPDQPLNVAQIRKGALRYALVVSRHQLSVPRGIETDPYSDYFGQPEMYELRGARGNPVQIHPSRVIPFHGSPLPAGAVSIAHIDQFWGDPLLMSVQGAINNAETSQAAVATLLHELKQDVISIPNLTETIATEGSERVIAARIEALNRFRSMFNALLLDGGDGEKENSGEKWETRQISFAQYPELLRQFLSIVAGAADIPVTRLLGESPGGLQSTGKGEQDDFNRSINALRDADLAPALARLDEILIPATLGERPEEIGYTFGDLSEPDETSESENEKREAETVEIYDRTNLIPKDALAKAAANRLIESGRWPGLDQAIEESKQELGALEDPEADPAAAPAQVAPPAANDDAVDEMERRGTITRDQALTLLADAAPRSLYVSRKLLNGDEFLAWAKAQGFGETLAADDLHVTIAKSRRPVDWIEADTDWAGDDAGAYTVKPGGPRLVEPLGDKGAVVLLFASSHLSYRHEEIRRLSGATHDFVEYQPHITITYAPPPGLDISTIEPYRGALRFGPEIFEEIDENWRKTHG